MEWLEPQCLTQRNFLLSCDKTVLTRNVLFLRLTKMCPESNGANFPSWCYYFSEFSLAKVLCKVRYREVPVHRPWNHTDTGLILDPMFLSCVTSALFLFLFFFHFFLNFIFKFYIIVLVLPNIKMNPPQAYTCSPSWTLLPPPSPHHPSG